jgi:hypothetical protein
MLSSISQHTCYQIFGCWRFVKMQYDQLDPTKMTQNELRIQFVTIRAELKYRDEALRDTRLQLVALQNQPKKKTSVWKMILAFSISILFGVTSIMFNVGTSMLTSKPPDPSGNILLVLAGIIFVICTLVSTFIVGGSNL